MTIEEVLQHDLKFRYMLLGRLQADCEYYLGFGNKSPHRLWAASLRKSSNTFLSLPSTPLLMHCSTERVSGFLPSK